MRLDLRKPQYDVAAVSVVAPNKCAVLLKSTYSSSSSTNNDSQRVAQENVVDDNTAVILQWHRIPLNGDEMSSDPPPPPLPTPPHGDEPDHRCSMSCMMSCPEGDKRRAWRRQKELWDKHVKRQNGGKRSKKGNNNDDDDVEYNWFPGSNTLLQEDKVSQTPPPNNCACMHSDGKGILVVMAGEEIQFWHVGTMSLVPCCDPFERDGLDFSPSIMVTNFTTCTIVSSKEKVEDGEGYEEELSREQQQQAKRLKLQEQDHDHDDPPVLNQNLQPPGAVPEKGPQPQQTPTAAAIDATLQFHPESKDSNISSAATSNELVQLSSVGSVQSEDFDLVHCDTESILRHFAHENSKQEREFEQGICGILGDPSDGSLIKRSTLLPVGSCSPQLECIVRVAFAIRSQASDQLNQIVVMDVEPLSSIRNRYQEGEDYYSEEYAQACLGQKGLWTAWCTNVSPSSDNSCEHISVFDWNRGGVLDFEHGESESERFDRYYPLISNTQSDEERKRLVCQLRAIGDLMGRDRAPLSIRIDAHKLIICTGHEVSIWPVELYNSICNGQSKILLHGCDDLLGMGTWDDAFSLDVETKPLYSARPMDKQFCHRWDEITYSADKAHDGESHTTDTQSIVRDFVAANLERQEHLMMMATYDRKIADAVFSWRYAVTVTSPTDSDDSSGQMLSIFDSLGDWARSTHSPFGVERIVTPRQKKDVDEVSTKVGIIIPGDREDDYDNDSGSEYDVSVDDESS